MDRNLLHLIHFSICKLKFPRKRLFLCMIVSMHSLKEKFYLMKTAGTLISLSIVFIHSSCCRRFCSRCKCHRKAEKKLDIWRLPSILIIHLKRFSFSGPFRDKLETPVDFPIRGLDLTAYCASSDRKPAIYDLYAITVSLKLSFVC